MIDLVTHKTQTKPLTWVKEDNEVNLILVSHGIRRGYASLGIDKSTFIFFICFSLVLILGIVVPLFIDFYPELRLALSSGFGLGLITFWGYTIVDFIGWQRQYKSFVWHHSQH